jgi:hypothetical protein
MAKNIYQKSFLKSENRWVIAFGGTQSKAEVAAEITKLNEKPVEKDPAGNWDYYTPTAYEPEMMATEKTIARYEARVAASVTCRKCGARSLDGANFTTLGGTNICDDCA